MTLHQRTVSGDERHGVLALHTRLGFSLKDIVPWALTLLPFWPANAAVGEAEA